MSRTMLVADREIGRTAQGAGSRTATTAVSVRARSRLIVVGLAVLLVIPLFVALGVLKQPRWYPIWDLALTEMQLRDVGTSHTPLTGPGGRVGALGERGSHPGPLGFYMMTPVYRLLGSTSWAMQIAAASVHVAAVGALLWLVHRRRSLGLALGVTAVLAVLVHGYGPEALTQAWNPYLPLLWWVVFLVSVWSVVCGDIPVLPVAAFAGSLCLQNHASYVVVVSGLGALAVVSIGRRVYRQRKDRGSFRRAAKWSLVALGVAVAVWVPPVIEQLSGSGDNLGILWRHFRNWTEEPVGFQRAFEVLLIHLNPWRLITRDLFIDRYFIGGSTLPGGLVLLTWAALAVWAIRLRCASLVRLHAVIAAALVLGVVTISRIGNVFYYLILWVWGITVLLLLAAGWTLSLLVGRHLKEATRQEAATRGRWALAGLAVAFTVVVGVNAAGADYGRRDSAVLDGLVPQVASTLERDHPRSGPYLLVWDEGITGGLGRGLMNELQRRGFEAGAGDFWRAEVKPQRVVTPVEAVAVLALATGPEIRAWRAKPGVRQIAHVDLTIAAQGKARGSHAPGTAVFAGPPAAMLAP
jgi:hypothetical protein